MISHLTARRGENTEQIFNECVEDLIETIPDAKKWPTLVKKEATVKIKSLVHTYPRLYLGTKKCPRKSVLLTSYKC